MLALASCVSKAIDAPGGERIARTGDAGRDFAARYTGNGNAVVVAGGRTYRLPGVMAASGARSLDGHVDYWEHHGEAMLNGAARRPYEQRQEQTRH